MSWGAGKDQVGCYCKDPKVAKRPQQYSKCTEVRLWICPEGGECTGFVDKSDTGFEIEQSTIPEVRLSNWKDSCPFLERRRP